MDVLVRFGTVASDSLPTLVQAVCHAVNAEKCAAGLIQATMLMRSDRHAQLAFQVIKYLLNGPLTFLSMRALCDTLENPENRASPPVLRGAVFLMGAP